MPRRRVPFQGLTLSRRATRAHYPEEWAWWAASGWQMMAEEAEDGALVLHTLKQQKTGGTLRWGARASAAELAQRGAVRYFLITALYLHLHPRKSRWAYEATGRYCTEEELAAFIDQQRRKVANAASSA